MRVSAEGKINERILILGHPIYPGYIVKGSNKTMMIEAGMNIIGPALSAAAPGTDQWRGFEQA